MNRLFVILVASMFYFAPSPVVKVNAQVITSDSIVFLPDSLLKPDSNKESTIEEKAQEEKVTKPLSGLKDTNVYNIISTGKILWALIIVTLAYFAIRIVIRLLQLFSEKNTRYRITIKGLIPLVRVLAWTSVVFFIIAGIFKPSMATLIAFSASVGVAVGFASQDILKNIFGGIVIIFDQPFTVGDKIEIGKYYGEVTEIGLRSTRLVTPDDSMVAVPNAELMNQSVSNSNTGELNCQVVVEFYLPLDIDTVKVRQLAIEAAQVSKYIYLNKPIAVLFFQEIKEKRTFFKMKLKAYVMDIRYEFAFKSDLTELLTREFVKEGIISKDF